MLQNVFFFCYFLLIAHSPDQTPSTRVFPPGTHYSDQQNKALPTMSLAQRHNILTPPSIQPTHPFH